MFFNGGEEGIKLLVDFADCESNNGISYPIVPKEIL